MRGRERGVWQHCTPCAGAMQQIRWCPRPDSNRYALRRGILSPLCLPVPPLGRGVATLTHQQARCAAVAARPPTRLVSMQLKESGIGRCAAVALLAFDATDRLDRQTQPALVVGFQNLEANDLANLEHVVDVRDTVVGDFGDVKQAV